MTGWTYWATERGAPSQELASYPSAEAAWDAWTDELADLRAHGPSGPSAYLHRCVIAPDGRVMDRDPREDDQPVGLVEVAELLDVERSTVDQWRTRGLLPPPQWTVGGRPAWSWPVIAAWALTTGRR